MTERCKFFLSVAARKRVYKADRVQGAGVQRSSKMRFLQTPDELYPTKDRNDTERKRTESTH